MGIFAGRAMREGKGVAGKQPGQGAKGEAGDGPGCGTKGQPDLKVSSSGVFWPFVMCLKCESSMKNVGHCP